MIDCANRAGGFEEVGEELLLALGDHAGAALHHGRLEHELRDAHRSAVRVLTEAVAGQDPVLHRETGELAVHAGLLATELGLDERTRDAHITATLQRAVGYLALPEHPRLRAGALTADERSLIEQAARSARRAAARLGGTAYRASGRRLGILVPARERSLAPGILEDVRAEFLAGPAIRAAISAWSPGETGEAVLARARDALKQDRA